VETKKSKERVILGVDPGTTILGYSILQIKNSKPEVHQYGVIKLSKYSNYQLKLKAIQERMSQIIESYSPDELAIEAPFYGKNAQSMLKLGRAQGVVIGCALRFGLPFTEYAPKKIKQAVTGNGNASKEQIAKMLEKILNIDHEKGIELDATDALGVALCHFFQPTGNQVSKKSWKAFASENKNRIINP
jgi:crossover junction endodeoxyribonuclease RuvC